MEIRYTLEEILQILGEGRCEGATDATVSGIASLEAAVPGELSFLGNSKYQKLVRGCHASLILLPEHFEGSPRPNQVYLFVKNPSLSLALICEQIEKNLWTMPDPGVHPSAVVERGVVIDPTAHVGPLCVLGCGVSIGKYSVLESQVYIGSDSTVGSDCRLFPGVYLGADCHLGDRVRLQPGVVIGSQGYGYENVDGAHRRLPQIGNVVIEDDVDVGANSTIDRARFGVTRIGRGTKIDNLVQIAHNVSIGKHCLIVAQAGISGSTALEDYVMVGGQVGTVGHIKIGEGSMLGAQAGVNHDIPAGSKVRGTPAYPLMEAQRVEILQRRLPELFKRISDIEEQMAESESEGECESERGESESGE